MLVGYTRRVKAGRRTNPGRENPAAGLHASHDSFYLTTERRRQDGAGVTSFSLAWLPRLCPLCGNQSIIGHGRRSKQVHDQHHDRIWVRRGLRRPCNKTFTILPRWSPPHGQYSLVCRQQAWEARCGGDGSWEQSAPQTKDPDRLPDPATLRRWACRRLLSWCCSLKAFWFRWAECQRFLCTPTILAWDWAAVSRNLRLEANSP
jgi:hypothetical protein